AKPSPKRPVRPVSRARPTSALSASSRLTVRYEVSVVDPVLREPGGSAGPRGRGASVRGAREGPRSRGATRRGGKLHQALAVESLRGFGPAPARALVGPQAAGSPRGMARGAGPSRV